MYLAVYLSRAGICSRRKAVELIKQGLVKINESIVLDPAVKVTKHDRVFFQDKEIVLPNFVYILFNKPADCITTLQDERGRKTVFDYVKTKEKVFPVGRLDKDTTGLLLLTNDGELAHQLMHPRLSIEKEYWVTLDRPIAKKDFVRLRQGIELTDGFLKPDAIYSIDDNLQHIGIVIHSGKKRVIRRFFAHVGYRIITLDRVRYAMLEKKDLVFGAFRELATKEVEALKKLTQKKTKRTSENNA